MVKNIRSKQKMREIAEDMVQRMLKGDVLTIDECAMQYFQPATELSAIKSKGKIASLIQRACKLIEGHGQVAGHLGKRILTNGDGEKSIGTWGIPKEEQLKDMLAGRYWQVAGRSKQALSLMAWARENHMELPGVTTVSISLPAPRNDLSSSL